MTDEELREIERTTALLEENGLVIKDTGKFIREMSNNKIEDVVSKLAGLQVSIDEGINAEAFSNDIVVGLDKISEVISADNYFRSNQDAVRFENLLNDLREKSLRISAVYRNTKKAEEILNRREEDLKDIRRRIFDLRQDLTLDDAARTSETIKLYYAKNKASQAREEAMKFYDEQKALSDKPLKIEDIIDFKNELLQAVNALDSTSRKLSMEPEKMDELASIIRETRDKIVIFGFETQKNQKEFDRLCTKFGLEKTGERVAQKVDAPAVEKKTEQVEFVKEEIPEVETTPEIKEEPKQEITTLEELISELKRLNPEIEVIRDGDTDGILVEDVANLVLPEGFKYTEGLGINNKKNDLEPYTSAFVKTKERDLGSDAPSVDDPKKEEEKEQTKKAPQEVGAESHVPSGRLAIKRTRRAIIAPYAKAVLCYGALGGVLTAMAGVGLAPIAPAMAIAAGIGVIGQRIYNKLVDRGVLDIPGAKYGAPDYELPVVGSYVIQDAKKLLQCLRDHKAKKKETEREEVIDEMPEVIEERPLAPSVDEIVKEVKGYEETPEVLAENEMEMHNIDDIVGSETPEYSEQETLDYNKPEVYDAVLNAFDRETKQKMEAMDSPVVTEEDKKNSLYDTFKESLGKELDEEVATLSNISRESQNIELQTDVPELNHPQFELPEHLNEQYWIKENPEESIGKGGR